MSNLYNPGCFTVNYQGCLIDHNKGCSVLIMTIGERINAARKACGLTQAQLAERSGLSQQMIHKLETGKSERTGYLGQIARALEKEGIDPLWIIDGAGQMFRTLSNIQLTQEAAEFGKAWEELPPKERAALGAALRALKEYEEGQVDQQDPPTSKSA